MTALGADVGHSLAAGVDAATGAAVNARDARELGHHLYTAWYGAPVADVEVPPDLPDELVGVLRAAHAGGDRWEGGWLVERAGRDGRIVATRNEEERLLDRCEYIVPARPGIVAGPGTTVLAPARRDHVARESGWWYTHHPDWRLATPPETLVRIYWNVGPSAAALLVRELSAMLLDCGVPWMLKCAIVMPAYRRADPAVLFLPRHGLERLSTTIDDARDALSEVLRIATPPLTLRLGDGVAVSDDPGTGESFGEHRCGLIAGGIFRGGDMQEPLSAVVQHFHDAGIPPDRPYVAHAARRLPWE